MTIINIMCGLCMLTRKHRHGHGKKTLQVERQDGKTLEFTAPILVEELLEQFPGAESVGLSHNHHLPLTYKLKLGRMYYLLPKTNATTPQLELKDESELTKRRRIKVVITKQRLRELVSNQLSLQDLLMERKTETETETAAAENKHNYACKCWKPELQSIPEDQGDE